MNSELLPWISVVAAVALRAAGIVASAGAFATTDRINRLVLT
jgi:hypothetical protein